METWYGNSKTMKEYSNL